MAGLNFQKVKTLSGLSGMPQMNNTLNGWEVPLTLVKVIQNVVEGDLVTTELKINFKGVWQPFLYQQASTKSPNQLALLPEGQRDWSHYWIHAKSGTLDLQTADKIIFQGNRYKVLERKDYGLNGYIEYHVILDYENTEV